MNLQVRIKMKRALTGNSGSALLKFTITIAQTQI
jgi:hypothetical protein